MSDDQKALLRLLASGQGYEDIAALLGTGVDEVKAKAAAAVAQLESEGIPAPALPGAPLKPAPVDPGPPSDPPPPVTEPAPPAPAPEPEPPLKPAPSDPEPPSDPPAPTQVASEPARPAAAKPAPARPKLSFPTDPAKRAAIAGGAIVLALIVIVLIVSGGGGSDDTGSTSAANTTTGEESQSQNAANSGNGKVTKAVLTDTGGGDAAGVAIFGRVKQSLALQVQATGLEPTTGSDSYTIWLAQSPQKMLPLASTAVKKDGKIAAQFEVPVEVLAYLAGETFKQIVVTRTDNAKLQAALKAATKAEEAPSYSGEEVLSGEVTGPIIGAQKRIEERQAEKKK